MKKGLGVAEAPKGGIANEAPLVGNNEDQIVGNGKGGSQQQNRLVGQPPSKQEAKMKSQTKG